MRQSQLFTKTRREAPADEVSKNAQLLIRAGYVHKEMAGVYAYLPLGLKVIENIKQIIRQEMNAVGGQEMAMTSLQRKELWEVTDRSRLRLVARRTNYRHDEKFHLKLSRPARIRIPIPNKTSQ
jgi:prolyl-tRNA synthetase